jgi:excisionase family DNA binding protein
MTQEKVCAHLKITKDWLYDQVEARRIPHIRLGRQLRFRRSDLIAHLELNSVPTVGEQFNTYPGTIQIQSGWKGNQRP